MKRDKGWRSVEVPTITLDTLRKGLKLSKIDLLKIDVEGAELEVLEQSDLQRIETVVGEVHCDLGRWGSGVFHRFSNNFAPCFANNPEAATSFTAAAYKKGSGVFFKSFELSFERTNRVQSQSMDCEKKFPAPVSGF